MMKRTTAIAITMRVPPTKHRCPSMLPMMMNTKRLPPATLSALNKQRTFSLHCNGQSLRKTILQQLSSAAADQTERSTAVPFDIPKFTINVPHLFSPSATVNGSNETTNRSTTKPMTISEIANLRVGQFLPKDDTVAIVDCGNGFLLDVRAQDDGFVEKVLVESGQVIECGQPIVQMSCAIDEKTMPELFAEMNASLAQTADASVMDIILISLKDNRKAIQQLAMLTGVLLFAIFLFLYVFYSTK